MFISETLISAIFFTWAAVTLPTLTLFGSLEPEPGFLGSDRPAAFFSSTGVGGVLTTKVNERSE